MPDQAGRATSSGTSFIPNLHSTKNLILKSFIFTLQTDGEIMKQYIVDAFTKKIFGGNPAAVVPLDKWLDKSLMLKIAAENNLSETAFFVQTGENEFDIKWFTPKVEIDLCGHATIASSFVIFDYLNYDHQQITFNSNSGKLFISKDEDKILMDFPAYKPEQVDIPEEIKSGLDVDILGVYKSTKYLVEVENQNAVLAVKPDFSQLAKLNTVGTIVTARGSDADFVSRFFAPGVGINEDPVTGSAHSVLTPFWAERLGKEKMFARQLSERGGEIFVEAKGERVLIGGNAVLFSAGEIKI